MKTLIEIKELVDKARSLQQDSTGIYRKFQDEFVKQRTEIQLNQDYSDKDKQKLLESLQKRKLVELMQGSRKLKNEYTKYWNEAKTAAEDLIHSKIPKVDPVKEERFNKRLDEVRTEILLSNAKKGKEILTQFLESLGEQAFAAKVKDEFPSLIQPILSSAGQDTAAYRQDLFKVFEDVKARSLPEEAAEAMNIVDSANVAMKNGFFIPLVEEKAKEHLGNDAGRYLNKPDEFFEKHNDADLTAAQLKTVEMIMDEEAKSI